MLVGIAYGIPNQSYKISRLKDKKLTIAAILADEKLTAFLKEKWIPQVISNLTEGEIILNTNIPLSYFPNNSQKKALVIEAKNLTIDWFSKATDTTLIDDLVIKTGIRYALGNESDDVELGGEEFYSNATDESLENFIKLITAAINNISVQ